ncbi:hypothetical protein [Ferruginibacter sp.]
MNTHWHFDHAEGNEWIHKTGATIILARSGDIQCMQTNY